MAPEGARAGSCPHVGLLADTLRFQLDDDFLMRPFRGRAEVGVVLARPLATTSAGPSTRSGSSGGWRRGGPARPGRGLPPVLRRGVGHRLPARDPPRAAPHPPAPPAVLGRCRPLATVPEGAVPVLLNSAEWYRALAESTYLVNNIDFDRWFTQAAGPADAADVPRLPVEVDGHPAVDGQAVHAAADRRRAGAAPRAGWDIVAHPDPGDGRALPPRVPLRRRDLQPRLPPRRRAGLRRTPTGSARRPARGSGIRPGQTRRALRARPGATTWPPTSAARRWPSTSTWRAPAAALGDDYVLPHARAPVPRQGGATARPTRLIDVTDLPRDQRPDPGRRRRGARLLLAALRLRADRAADGLPGAGPRRLHRRGPRLPLRLRLERPRAAAATTPTRCRRAARPRRARARYAGGARRVPRAATTTCRTGTPPSRSWQPSSGLLGRGSSGAAQGCARWCRLAGRGTVEVSGNQPRHRPEERHPMNDIQQRSRPPGPRPTARPAASSPASAPASDGASASAPGPRGCCSCCC